MYITSWVLRVIVAAGFSLMGFIPKLTAQPEAVALFEQLGVGAPGMYLTGALEALVVVLILVPQTIVFGAVLAAAMMIGAIGSHVAKLGFEGNNGALAGTAVVLLALSIATLAVHKRGVAHVIGKLTGR